MADVTLTIDGVEVTVPEGTTVVDAARQVGISIPVFCYHPRMLPVGMCRMCLVSVGTPRVDRETGKFMTDEKGEPVVMMMPRLQTACTTLVSPGMRVLTNTDEVKAAQRGILEFLLTSHPLDCPVCDKGGECPLQNLTMEWGPGESRFEYSEKAHFEKPVPLGNLIFLDRERCILCGRCVRFQDELADDPVLGFDLRGRQWHIISKSEPPFDSKFSGNTTDICPVGALTTADFRFRARVWEVKPIPSLCLHCSVGCNTTLDMRLNSITRVMPRENAAVNDIWICNKGRFGHRYPESNERLTTPLVRQGGELKPASWEEALRVVGEKLAAIHRAKGGAALAGLAGEHLSNEDLYLFQRLFREVLGSSNIDHRSGAPGEPSDDIVGVELGVGSGTNLLTLGEGAVVLVVGADPEEEAPLYMLRLREIVKRGGELVVANVRPTKLDRSATTSLRYRPGTERSLARGLLSAVLNQAGTRNLPARTSGQAELRASLEASGGSFAEEAGVSPDDIEAVARKFVEAEHGIIIYGADALAAGTAFTRDLGSLALLAGKTGKPGSGMIALLPRGNSRGALDMGVAPDRGPGYAPLTAPGPGARAMWGAAVEGQISGMYLAGIDPLGANPAARAALEKLELLVVQDMFLTPTAEHAHVVLPAVAPVERDGTYTNVERRVQRARQARTAPGTSKPDWEIIQNVANTFIEALAAQQEPPEQSAWDYLTVGDIASEIAEQVPGYRGITYSALALTGQLGNWGRHSTEMFYYDGTSYLNKEGVGMQYPSWVEASSASFSVQPLDAETPVADERYPFVLLVQQVLYNGDPLLRDSLLLAHVPHPYVVLNPNDAQAAAITTGDRVEVASVAGALEFVARVSLEIPAGSVLVPAGLPATPLATIQTGPHTRVALRKQE